MKNLIMVSFILLIFGCATPKSVVKLSHQQVELQKSYLVALENYFDNIERFLENYRQMSCRDFEKSYQEDIKDIQEELKEKYQKTQISEKEREDLINDVVKLVKKAIGKLDDKKKRFDAQINEFKEKNKILKDYMKKILETQATLDGYIKTKKFIEETYRQLIYDSGIMSNPLKELFQKIEKEVQ